MNTYNMNGDGNVIGNYNSVTINKTQSQVFNELTRVVNENSSGEALASLLKDIETLKNGPSDSVQKKEAGGRIRKFLTSIGRITGGAVLKSLTDLGFDWILS